MKNLTFIDNNNFSYFDNIRNKYCSYYYYFDNNSCICTYNYSCPNKYNKLMPDNLECIDEYYKDIIYIKMILLYMALKIQII